LSQTRDDAFPDPGRAKPSALHIRREGQFGSLERRTSQTDGRPRATRTSSLVHELMRADRHEIGTACLPLAARDSLSLRVAGDGEGPLDPGSARRPLLNPARPASGWQASVLRWSLRGETDTAGPRPVPRMSEVRRHTSFAPGCTRTAGYRRKVDVLAGSSSIHAAIRGDPRSPSRRISSRRSRPWGYFVDERTSWPHAWSPKRRRVERPV
jgi:hypothetical protein